MDRQLLKRLIHNVDHYLCTGQDGYGDKAFDLPTARKCYREGKITQVKNEQGELITTNLKLYFDGVFPITGKDEILFDGVRYPVATYAQFDGLKAGTGTTVVYL